MSRTAFLAPLPIPTRRARVALAALLASLYVALPAAAQKQPERQLLAFGDSITLGLGDGNVSCFGGPTGGYPPRLSDQLEDRNYPNTMRTSAVCGELTSQGVSRLPGILSSRPDTDVVILLEGTNDLSNRDISTESMRFNIEKMGETVLERGMRPVIAAPPPRSPEVGTNERTGFLTFLIREDAEENDIDFANTYDGLLTVPDLYDRFYSDPYHPNSDGYGIVANILRQPTIDAIARTIQPPEPCAVGPENLCLAAERFEVKVEWADSDGNEGMGRAVGLTGDTGFFWFFDESNIELVIKVLDARTINGHFWVFYGALSDVEYTITVTDTMVGTVKTYSNALGNLASRGDTGAFPAPDETQSVMAGAPSAPTSAPTSPSISEEAGPTWISAVVPIPFREGESSTRTEPRSRKMECTTDGTTLCLNESRFALGVDWKDAEGQEGSGTAVEVTPDTGYFWFFDEDNVELVIKVLDAREINGHFWVFYGALSNVEYTITVTDTETDAGVIYTNPQGEFGSRSDTEAFEVP